MVLRIPFCIHLRSVVGFSFSRKVKMLYPIEQGTILIVPGIQFRSLSTCAAGGQEGALTGRWRCTCWGRGRSAPPQVSFLLREATPVLSVPCSDRPLSYDPCPSFRLCYDFGWWCNLFMCLNKVGSSISLSSSNLDICLKRLNVYEITILPRATSWLSKQSYSHCLVCRLPVKFVTK